MEGTNFCPECGNHVLGGTRYCAKCGTQLDSFEPASESESTRSVQNEFTLAGRESPHRPWRRVLAGIVAVLVFGAGGYVGVRFLRESSHSSPSETVRTMVVAANDRQAGAFQQNLSRWFLGETERLSQRGGRPLENLLAEFSHSGSIEQVDILAERICGQEASVFYRLRFASAESRRELAHLVTENGIWKVNGLRGDQTCSVPGEPLGGQPLHSWSVTTPKESPGEVTAVQSSSLSRPAAEKLLQQGLPPGDRDAHEVAINYGCAIKAGVVRRDRAPYNDMQTVYPTSLGGTLFIVPHWDFDRRGALLRYEFSPPVAEGGSGIVPPPEAVWVALQAPIQVTVTGIQANDKQAIVGFELSYDLSAETLVGVRPCIVSSNKLPGQAVFELWDDGWRLPSQHVEWSPLADETLRSGWVR